MIDNFALVLAHGLLLVVMWRLVRRGDLDVEPAPGAVEPPAGPGRMR